MSIEGHSLINSMGQDTRKPGKVKTEKISLLILDGGGVIAQIIRDYKTINNWYCRYYPLGAFFFINLCRDEIITTS